MKRCFYIIVILCLSLVTSCNKKTYKTVDKTEGYKGAAKSNPYLAAEALLKEIRGGEVRSQNGFVNFDHDTGMVISPASTLSSEIMVDKMLQWVQRGGVYVCLLERGEKHWLDVGQYCQHETDSWKNTWNEDKEKDKALQHLLDKMNIELVPDPSGKTTGGKSYAKDPKNPVALGEKLPLVEKVKVNDGRANYELKIGGTQVMKMKKSHYVAALSDKGKYHRFLRQDVGLGKIYFFTDARLFRNPYLAMSDHAAMLEKMSFGVQGDIVFGFGDRRGFWSLMISYAWPALLGVFALLVFWLWKNIPRFGPLLEIPEGQARYYAQAVSNTGRFLWKYKSSDVLLTSLRDHLFRTSGMFHADGQVKEAMFETFAEKSGLGIEEVIEALTRNNVNEAGDMVRITRNLQTIQKSL